MNKFEIRSDGKVYLNGAEIQVTGYTLKEDIEDIGRLTLELPIKKIDTLLCKDKMK